MTTSGVEDDFILFPMDSVELSGEGEKKLLGLICESKEAIIVHIHGYASEEGDQTYNLNLSAHRGAAVKRFLDGHLPKDSQVTIYAHGETKEFGSAAKNQRVRVECDRRHAQF